MKELNRQEAIRFLLEYPYLFGHLIGFKDLNQMHNEWIKDMVLGEEDELQDNVRFDCSVNNNDPVPAS